MLTAAELLGNHSNPAAYTRRLVFVALAGEGWGSMGTKRLLWEMSRDENSTKGLSMASIDQVDLLILSGCLHLEHCSGVWVKRTSCQSQSKVNLIADTSLSRLR